MTSDEHLTFRPDYLPFPIPDTRWIDYADTPQEWRARIDAEAARVAKAPGWNPKLVKLEGKLVMIDLCIWPDSDAVHSIHVVENVDHPMLAKLPSNAPRAVKAIYRKETRMAFLRASDSWHFSHSMDRALEAWRDYHSPRKATERTTR